MPASNSRVGSRKLLLQVPLQPGTQILHRTQKNLQNINNLLKIQNTENIYNIENQRNIENIENLQNIWNLQIIERLQKIQITVTPPFVWFSILGLGQKVATL